jgi:hypothetical protein
MSSFLRTKWTFGHHAMFYSFVTEVMYRRWIILPTSLDSSRSISDRPCGMLARSYSRMTNALLHQNAEQIDICVKEIARTIRTRFSSLIASIDSSDAWQRRISITYRAIIRRPHGDESNGGVRSTWARHRTLHKACLRETNKWCNSSVSSCQRVQIKEYKSEVPCFIRPRDFSSICYKRSFVHTVLSVKTRDFYFSMKWPSLRNLQTGFLGFDLHWPKSNQICREWTWLVSLFASALFFISMIR